MKIDATTHDIQEIAEIAAALELGNSQLESTAVRAAYYSLQRLIRKDTKHYLFLRHDDDLGSFFGCGSARGATDTMVEDRRHCRLYTIPKNECPNCKEEES